MRVGDVSHITQRMIFLRIYEVLVEANQSVIDRRDLAASHLEWHHFDAGYPFCYFTGEVLDDLLKQPIVWQGQHLVLEQALWQLQPDLQRWLTQDVRQVKINDFFNWHPHTQRVQELVDDVKARVLDVVDAIHGAERLQQMDDVPRMLQICLPDQKIKKITTGAIAHSLTYRLLGTSFEPVVQSASMDVSRKWYMHALIHGMWLVGQAGGHVKLDSHHQKQMVMQAPLFLV